MQGIGPVNAASMVEAFGDPTFEIIVTALIGEEESRVSGSCGEDASQLSGWSSATAGR